MPIVPSRIKYSCDVLFLNSDLIFSHSAAFLQVCKFALSLNIFIEFAQECFLNFLPTEFIGMVNVNATFTVHV